MICGSCCSGRGEVLHAGRDGVLLREKESGICFWRARRRRTIFGWQSWPQGDAHPSSAGEREKLLGRGGGAPFRTAGSWSIWARRPGSRRRICASLGPEWLEEVHAHYHPEDDGRYLLDRLGRGLMLGAFVDDMLAGFIGVHSEGSMGLLEVFPAYRRRGLASALERGMIYLQMRKGWQPLRAGYRGQRGVPGPSAKAGPHPGGGPCLLAVLSVLLQLSPQEPRGVPHCRSKMPAY